MLKIGLTGGIGSGKSTVAHIFQILGIPVYNADDAAKKLMVEDKKLKTAIISAFGKRSYGNGNLDREYIASLVFNNKEKLDLLNSLVHPVTIRDAKDWFQKQHAAYAIKEAALIFESGTNNDLDYVIGVQSPLKLRIQRTMDRDHISEDEIKARIDNQMKEEEKIKRCNFILVNNEREMVIPQVLNLHEKLLKLSASV
jgi:dephospho-CoA kinase